MPMTRVIHSRIDDAALAQARGAHPELAGLDPSKLIRVALAVLAGRGVPDAIAATRPAKSGPKPKAGAAA